MKPWLWKLLGRRGGQRLQPNVPPPKVVKPPLRPPPPPPKVKR